MRWHGGLPHFRFKRSNAHVCGKKPCMDFLSSKGQVGLVKTVPDGMKPGSDVAIFP